MHCVGYLLTMRKIKNQVKQILAMICFAALCSCNLFPSSNTVNDSSEDEKFITDSVIVSFDTLNRASLFGDSALYYDSIGDAFNALVMSKSSVFTVLEQRSTYSYMELNAAHLSLLPKSIIHLCKFPDTVVVKTANTKESIYGSSNESSYTIDGSALDITYFNTSMETLGIYKDHHFRMDTRSSLNCNSEDGAKSYSSFGYNSFISYKNGTDTFDVLLDTLLALK